MTEIAPFSNDEFRLEIAPHDTDGFHVRAPGVARQLGFRDAARMLETVPDAEKGYTLASTPGGEQRVSYLTEKGFYRVLGQRQAARVTDPDTRAFVTRFQDWVYGEVLPKLRRGELVAAKPAFDPATLSRLDILKLAMQAEEEKAVLEAALESAAPAIAYHERFVVNDDASTVKDWAASWNITGPQAWDNLLAANVVYRKTVGYRWSKSKGRMVEEFEYRARAGRVTFDWFDLRPQHNAPRLHNGQVRHTLYVRQAFALDLGRKIGLSQPVIPGADVVLRGGDAA